MSLVLGSACASAPPIKPPSMRVDGLHVDKLGITGAALDVTFNIQNPNPNRILIEKFEYDLILSGGRLGKGYQADPVEIEGFKDARVVSRFNLNLLSLPGTVKAILQQDGAAAHVEGTFYIRERGDLRSVPFIADANVNLTQP